MLSSVQRRSLCKYVPPCFCQLHQQLPLSIVFFMFAFAVSPCLSRMPAIACLCFPCFIPALLVLSSLKLPLNLFVVLHVGVSLTPQHENVCIYGNALHNIFEYFFSRIEGHIHYRERLTSPFEIFSPALTSVSHVLTLSSRLHRTHTWRRCTLSIRPTTALIAAVTF